MGYRRLLFGGLQKMTMSLSPKKLPRMTSGQIRAMSPLSVLDQATMNDLTLANASVAQERLHGIETGGTSTNTGDELSDSELQRWERLKREVHDEPGQHEWRQFSRELQRGTNDMGSATRSHPAK